MINISGLAHIGIRVANFKRAIGFYSELGFSLIRDDQNERVVVLKHFTGLEINLLDSVNIKNHQRNILMDEAVRYPGITHLALAVVDIHRAKAALHSRRIKITEGPVTFGDGSTSIFFRDPDRNVIELSQPLKQHQSLHDKAHSSPEEYAL